MVLLINNSWTDFSFDNERVDILSFYSILFNYIPPVANFHSFGNNQYIFSAVLCESWKGEGVEKFWRIAVCILVTKREFFFRRCLFLFDEGRIFSGCWRFSVEASFFLLKNYLFWKNVYIFCGYKSVCIESILFVYFLFFWK